MIAFDTETHLIQPGLLAPPLVCGAFSDGETTFLLDADDTRRRFAQILKGVSGGTNYVYDLGVMAADNPALLTAIFNAIDEGRCFSTDILEALHDNARGLLFREASGAPFQRYSQLLLEARYTGVDRSADKADGWRLRYAELDGVPIDQWPQEAIDYPRRDAKGAFDLLEIQTGAGRSNLQCSTQEMRAAWFLQLASIWGVRTDPVMVAEVTAEIVKEHEESRRKFFEAGLVRVRPCNKKDGEYERGDEISAEWLEAQFLRMLRLPELHSAEERLEIGKALKALEKGRPIRFAENKEAVRALVNAAYHGEPPMTAGGESGNQQISTSRDTLTESGDPLLEEYGEAGANEKLLSTYVDVLKQGTEVPINPRTSSFLSTQRASYYQPNLQQLPRKGRIRNCFVPRDENTAADYL